MNKEEMLTDLLEQGSTEEEALEKIEEYEKIEEENIEEEEKEENRRK